jgi:hypothetical protein
MKLKDWITIACHFIVRDENSTMEVPGFCLPNYYWLINSKIILHHSCSRYSSKTFHSAEGK